MVESHSVESVGAQLRPQRLWEPVRVVEVISESITEFLKAHFVVLQFFCDDQLRRK